MLSPPSKHRPRAQSLCPPFDHNFNCSISNCNFLLQRNPKNAARWSNNCHSPPIARTAPARGCAHAPISSASCPAMRRTGDPISEKRRINSFDRSTSRLLSLRLLFRSRHQTVRDRFIVAERSEAKRANRSRQKLKFFNLRQKSEPVN